MLNLYTPIVAKIVEEEKFGDGEKLSVLYHNIFDYPLTFAELIRWSAGKSITGITDITSKNGYYFVEGREKLIYKRFLRKRVSLKKMGIAKKASKVLSLIPSVKMVAITGSLAMGNSTNESDIDLMIVTKKGSLWSTRILAYLLLYATRYTLRRPRTKSEQDALCLNMWLDESDLIFKDHNLYTAHEIAQIVPLINKDKTYEKFLLKNKWVLKYWPNAVRISSKHQVASSMRKQNPLLHATYYVLLLFEKLAFFLQYQYMKPKITREVVTKTRALFHPQDWGKIVLSRLASS